MHRRRVAISKYAWRAPSLSLQLGLRLPGAGGAADRGHSSRKWYARRVTVRGSLSGDGSDSCWLRFPNANALRLLKEAVRVGLHTLSTGTMDGNARRATRRHQCCNNNYASRLEGTVQR